MHNNVLSRIISLFRMHTPNIHTLPHSLSRTHTLQIRNYLIDTHQLNEVRLAEAFEDGKRVVTRDIENVHLPNGVHHQLKRRCYNLNNARMRVERVQTMSKSGGLGSVYVGSNRLNPYDVDISGQKSQVVQQLQEAKTKLAGLKQSMDIMASEKNAAFKALGQAAKEHNEVDKQVRDVAQKIKLEEEKQAKFMDVDQDGQDQEILQLMDTSAFDEEEKTLVQQIEVSIHTNPRAHKHIHRHARVHARLHRKI